MLLMFQIPKGLGTADRLWVNYIFKQDNIYSMFNECLMKLLSCYRKLITVKQFFLYGIWGFLNVKISNF
jgi:hypothetical protein